jgi:Holliday junction resolvase RusA-like endonuclease
MMAKKRIKKSPKIVDRRKTYKCTRCPSKIKTDVHAISGLPYLKRHGWVGAHTVSIRLPMPPTVNNFYAVVRGRKITSAEGRAWIAEAVAACHRQVCGHPFRGEVKVEATVYRARRAGDLSNRIKPVEDVLQKAEILVNDSQIAELHWKRRDDKANPHVYVTITELAP